MAVGAPAWSDAVDEVIGGDQVVAVAFATPARGCVVLPLTNVGLRDRLQGTLTPVTSSIGMWRKLARIAEAPELAVAYHTRVHGFSDRPEFVLVQGRAQLSPLEDRGWIARNRAAWDRFCGSRDVGPLWERWLRAYHWRVAVELDVARVVAWPDLRCAGEPSVSGLPLGGPPASQREPAGGTGPRVDHRRVAARAQRLPDVLLGWIGDDELPIVAPVRIGDVTSEGIVVEAASGILPEGSRRAGMLAHSFARYTFGQHQRKHSGWLTVAEGGRRGVYAPHTAGGHVLPPSRLLYRLSAGFVTRAGLRGARRAGFVSD